VLKKTVVAYLWNDQNICLDLASRRGLQRKGPSHSGFKSPEAI